MSVLILSHGGLAPELLASARKVVGRDLEDFYALPLEWSDGIEEGQVKVREALKRLGEDTSILILTDIFGGTPSNLAYRFHEPGRVEVVSGVNLPMVVRLGCLGTRHYLLDQLASWIRDKARSSICCSSEWPQPGTCRSGQEKKPCAEPVREESMKPISCEDTDG